VLPGCRQCRSRTGVVEHFGPGSHHSPLASLRPVTNASGTAQPVGSNPTYDAIVIGAGFGGLYALHHLRDEMGLSASGVPGGTTATRVRESMRRAVRSTPTPSAKSWSTSGCGPRHKARRPTSLPM
jgi:hypothetical protein